jgi:ubiquitin-protein ligase E3 C
MFNYEELNYIISGQGVIDVEDLRMHARVVGFDHSKNTVKYFWEVVKELTEEQKSKLLMFVTACPRPSFLGFKELSPPFTVICMKDKEDLLPISHTCSNVLELPDYNDKELLRKKLITAIESNAGFEFG